MIFSMTGFASKTFSLSTDTDTPSSITVSIKSLNSRFFESTFKIPYALSFLETDLIQLCKSKLKRGHIFFSISMSNPNLFKAAVEPSTALVQSYLDAIKHITTSFSISGELTVAELIQLPNIFTMEEKGVDEDTKKLILQATRDVLDQLMTVREEEGTVLAQDIEQRCHHLKRSIGEIDTLAEQALTKRKEDVGARLQELGIAEHDAADAQRITLYNELNKMDINEEIVRFKSHLDNLNKTLHAQDVEKGKRIDFTLQELLREINTIAAKCSDVAISSQAINIKVELEKIREQNQNIV